MSCAAPLAFPPRAGMAIPAIPGLWWTRRRAAAGFVLAGRVAVCVFVGADLAAGIDMPFMLGSMA